jgi:hypothetical protein
MPEGRLWATASGRHFPANWSNSKSNLDIRDAASKRLLPGT